MTDRPSDHRNPNGYKFEHSHPPVACEHGFDDRAKAGLDATRQRAQYAAAAFCYDLK